jgi:ssDNA-binding Zn-finger/Zn-ribbon topoisomerase 1
MNINCEDCKTLVVEGEIVIRKNKVGNTKKVFDIYGKPNGTILKNNSENPEDWTGVCSKCQGERDRNARKKR